MYCLVVSIFVRLGRAARRGIYVGAVEDLGERETNAEGADDGEDVEDGVGGGDVHFELRWFRGIVSVRIEVEAA